MTTIKYQVAALKLQGHHCPASFPRSRMGVTPVTAGLSPVLAHRFASYFELHFGAFSSWVYAISKRLSY
jgi:hypothetical protein